MDFLWVGICGGVYLVMYDDVWFIVVDVDLVFLLSNLVCFICYFDVLVMGYLFVVEFVCVG